MDDDKSHLVKLDPYVRGRRLSELNMDALRPFVRDRKQKDGVQNATVNRALEIVRRILYLARDDWGWLLRVPAEAGTVDLYGTRWWGSWPLARVTVRG